jgi:mannose-6-phosphate isomerase-like protein (cupin superfamily)
MVGLPDRPASEAAESGQEVAMGYPPARYHGERGEVTATMRRTVAPAELAYPTGTTVDYLATGASTDGLFGLYRWTMPASGGGPGPHFHRSLDESFFVLLGTIKIFDGRDWLDAEVGDFVHVPPGGLHGFRNDSGAAASMLIHFAPGAPRERYMEGLAEWARSGRPSDADAAEFYRQHDNFWVEEI